MQPDVPGRLTTKRQPIDRRSPIEAERDILAKMADDADFDANAFMAISNIYRAATAIRNKIERELLTSHGLSWGGFTALFVLWVWGSMEAHQLASECGLAKGTLTGIVTTLENKDLVTRTRHQADLRRIVVALTPNGTKTIEQVFPLFHEYEKALTQTLSAQEKVELAEDLRAVIQAAQ